MRLSALWWLPAGKAPEVSPEELARWLEEGRSLQLVDARARPEYERGTIRDSRHAPLTEMPASMERLEFDPTRPVVVLCLTGHRSLPGARWLRARGIEAYSLKGGIMAWRRAGYRLDKAQTQDN